MPTKKSSVKTPSKEEYDDLALECEQRKHQVEQAQEVAEQAQAAVAQLDLERSDGVALVEGAYGEDHW